MMFLGKELTVERIREAYESTLMAPVCRTWTNGVGRCCALSAVLYAEGEGEFVHTLQRVDLYEALEVLSERVEIPASWLRNFVSGFDKIGGGDPDSEAYKLGAAARKEMLP